MHAFPTATRSIARLAVLAALFLSGCGGTGTEPDPSEAATANSSSESESAASAPSEAASTPEGGADTASPSAEPSASPTAPPTAAGAEGRTIQVAVAGGAVQTDSPRVEVALGEPLRIEVTSDTADEIHVHGYDVFADVAPGAPAVLELTADIPGVFEVELEDAGLTLVELQVQ